MSSMLQKTSKIVQQRAQLLYFILLTIISFLPFTLMYPEPNTLPITPYNGFEYVSFNNFYSMWHEAYLGRFTSLFTPHLLYVFSLFNLFPSQVAQTLLLGSIKFFAGISIYILLKQFTKNKAIQILGSLFYVLSIYGQAITGFTPTGGYLFYAVLPLTFNTFITIDKTNQARKYFVYILAMLLLLDTNLTYIAYFFIFIFLYACYTIFVKNDWSRLKYFFIFLGLFILVYQVYFLPTFADNYIYRSDVVQTNLSAESVKWKSGYSSVTEIIRLMGSLDFYDAFFLNDVRILSRPFFTYFTLNNLIEFISYLFPLLAVLGFINWYKRTKATEQEHYKFFYFATFLIFVFFSMGVHETNPFKDIYEFLSQKIFLFAIFRDPYKSVAIINLLYAIGIVFAFNYFTQSKKLFLSSTIAFCVLLFMLSFSYLLGDIYKKSEMIKVPIYVYEFANWNSSDNERYNSKKLFLPSQPFPILKFAMQKGKGSSIFIQMMNSNMVQDNANFTPHIRAIQNTVYKNNFQQIVGFYNIPYIVVVHDTDSDIYKSENSEHISTQLKKTMNLIKSFGPQNMIEVFAVDKAFVKEVVYIPERVVYGKIDTEKKENFEVFRDKKNNNLAFVDNNKYVKNLSGKNQAKLKVVKKSNYSYDLKISNLREGSLLVFNETYSKGWVIKKPADVFQSTNFKQIFVNGFANGYYLDPAQIKKEFQKSEYIQNKDGSITVNLQLYFQPQLYFYAGLAISGAVVVWSISYLLYDEKRRRKKHEL